MGESYFTNLTRHNDIGANSYLLELGGTEVILDAGMHPKYDGYEALPDLDGLRGYRAQAIFITHAHHDHIGALPVMMRHQPEARVFMSEPTYYLADPLLHNSVNIMKKQRVELNRPEYPLYTHRELQDQCKVWQAVGMDKRWSLRGYPVEEDVDYEDFTFRFHHAGHILGSVSIELQTPTQRILYTGDINFHDQTLMKGATLPEKGIDTLIIETTRGTTSVPGGYSRKEAEENLITSINEVFEKGGSVLMPIFAMGKTQELLTLLYTAQRKGLLPDNPIHIGGLGSSFTKIYDQFSMEFLKPHRGLSMANDIEPQVLDLRKLTDFRPKRNHLYLLPAGMMTEQTTSNRMAHRWLHLEEHGVFFVGYVAPETPAGRLLRTNLGDEFRMNAMDDPLPLKARIEKFDFTSHAQREDLLDYICKLRPKRCFLVHGDPEAMEWFQEQIPLRNKSIDVQIPKPGERICIDQ